MGIELEKNSPRVPLGILSAFAGPSPAVQAIRDFYSGRLVEICSPPPVMKEESFTRVIVPPEPIISTTITRVTETSINITRPPEVHNEL